MKSLILFAAIHITCGIIVELNGNRSEKSLPVNSKSLYITNTHGGDNRSHDKQINAYEKKKERGGLKEDYVEDNHKVVEDKWTKKHQKTNGKYSEGGGNIRSDGKGRSGSKHQESSKEGKKKKHKYSKGYDDEYHHDELKSKKNFWKDSNSSGKFLRFGHKNSKKFEKHDGHKDGYSEDKGGGEEDRKEAKTHAGGHENASHKEWHKEWQEKRYPKTHETTKSAGRSYAPYTNIPVYLTVIRDIPSASNRDNYDGKAVMKNLQYYIPTNHDYPQTIYQVENSIPTVTYPLISPRGPIFMNPSNQNKVSSTSNNIQKISVDNIYFTTSVPQSAVSDNTDIKTNTDYYSVSGSGEESPSVYAHQESSDFYQDDKDDNIHRPETVTHSSNSYDDYNTPFSTSSEVSSNAESYDYNYPEYENPHLRDSYIHHSIKHIPPILYARNYPTSISNISFRIVHE